MWKIKNKDDISLHKYKGIPKGKRAVKYQNAVINNLSPHFDILHNI